VDVNGGGLMFVHPRRLLELEAACQQTRQWAVEATGATLIFGCILIGRHGCRSISFIVFRHIDPNLIGWAFRSFDSEDAEFEIRRGVVKIDNIRIDGIAAKSLLDADRSVN
jgi:hypothetical protein